MTQAVTKELRGKSVSRENNNILCMKQNNLQQSLLVLYVLQSAEVCTPHFQSKLVKNVSCQAGTNVLTYGSHDDDDEEDDVHVPEGDVRGQGDPCFHYTILDQAWRSTNATTKFKMCDRKVKWKGNWMWTVCRGGLRLSGVPGLY